MQLADRLLGGDVRGLARAISLVEEGSPAAVPLLQRLFSRAGRAVVVGVTGSPGTGKSTLVDQLVAEYRRRPGKVGVVAIDPSSAFSGGAILGDRIRMQSHADDDGVFIRSMATRGQLGGLAKATNDAIDLIDAAGFDPILVETVGVGQDEIEVVRTADAVVVVLVPGLGDDIQAIKAGILEIADVFVINKADRDGADRLHAELDAMLSLSESPHRARPAIVRTVATRGEGLTQLREAIDGFLQPSAEHRRTLRRKERAEARLLGILAERVLQRLRQGPLARGRLEQLVEEIAERRLDPYTAANRVLERGEVA